MAAPVPGYFLEVLLPPCLQGRAGGEEGDRRGGRGAVDGEELRSTAEGVGAHVSGAYIWYHGILPFIDP